MNEWIQWNGGERPVDRYDTVDAKLRNGTISNDMVAVNLRWSHKDSQYDILAYRRSRATSTVVEQSEPADPDMVNAPPHYNHGGIECIEAIRAALTPEEFRGNCKANAMKYIWRERYKGGDESIRKAIWYLQEMLK